MKTETSIKTISHAHLNEKELLKWLHPVEDPEVQISLVDLGLIYQAKYVPEQKTAQLWMTLTSPACPLGDWIVQKLKNRALEHPEIERVEIELVWNPPWDPKTMATEEAKEVLGIW